MKRALILAIVLFAGCREPDARTYAPRERAESMMPESVARSPVSGHLAGTPFTMRSAWYRVVRRPGHARLDLVVSEGAPSRLCARPTPADARQVVVRHEGTTALTPGPLRADPSPSAPFRVFYEHPGEHGFEGVGGASALVVIDAIEANVLLGRLRACFPDATGSCVGGAFRAEECRDELDFDGPRGGRTR